MIFVIGGTYQGKTAYVKEHFPGYKIENEYHLKVKEQMQSGKNPLREAEKLLEEDRELIVISDEIGYGLVPTDGFERTYREMSGRVNCYFASQAEQVIRVICGIGTRIK